MSAGIFEATAPTGYGAQSIERFKSFRLGDVPSGHRRQRVADALRRCAAVPACHHRADSPDRLRESCEPAACARERARSRSGGARRDRRVPHGADSSVRGRKLRACRRRSGRWRSWCRAASRPTAAVRDVDTAGQRPSCRCRPTGACFSLRRSWPLATCIIFGLAPALRASRIDAIAAMKSGSRGATAGPRTPARSAADGRRAACDGASSCSSRRCCSSAASETS